LSEFVYKIFIWHHFSKSRHNHNHFYIWKSRNFHFPISLSLRWLLRETNYRWFDIFPLVNVCAKNDWESNWMGQRNIAALNQPKVLKCEEILAHINRILLTFGFHFNFNNPICSSLASASCQIFSIILLEFWVWLWCKERRDCSGTTWCHSIRFSEHL